MKTLESAAGVRFANILFTTDLSEASENALPYAIEIAQRYHATIHAVHAVQPYFNPLVLPGDWPKLTKKEEDYLQACQRHFEEQLQDVRHEVIFQPGDTWTTLAEIIRKKEIDLIVLSTHGRTGLGKALLGSVAEQIFRHALCPVLTVGPHISLKPKQTAPLSCILYATDFSAESLVGAPYAVSLAREHRARLILLHCLEGAGDIATYLGALHDIVPFGSELRCEPDCIVERGLPTEKILEVAEGHAADMIVLGVHGADGHLAKITPFASSGAYQIVTRAKSPVLTVRG